MAVEISVKDFGAKGNDIDDDTKAIQSALDHIIANGGGTLLFPKGTYKIISGEINDYILKLENGNQILLKGIAEDQSVLKAYRMNRNLGQWMLLLKNVSDIRFENLTFRGEHELSLDQIPFSQAENSPNRNAHTGIEILGTGSKIFIDNCKFQYFFGPSISASFNGSDLKISNCDFENCMREVFGTEHPQPTGILSNGEVHNITIENSNFTNIVDIAEQGTKAHAIYLANVKVAKVHHNNFKMDESVSFNTNNSGGFQVFSGKSEDINVYQNYFQNVTSNLYSAKKIVFHDNQLVNARLTINAEFTVVENNDFRLTKEAGSLGLLRTSGKVYGLELKNNTFFHQENASRNSYAIQLYQDSQSCQIEGNTIENFGTGIYLGHTSPRVIKDCTISKNKIIISKNSSVGMEVKAGQNTSIIDNEGLLKDATFSEKQFYLISSEQPTGEVSRGTISNNTVEGNKSAIFAPNCQLKD